MNILVTCGGGFQGLTVLKELERIKSVNTYLADIHQDNCSKYFAHFFFPSPPVSETKQYVDFITSVCVESNLDFIIPATSYDLTILSSLKASLKQQFGCHVLVPDLNYMELLLDKGDTSTFLSDNGINVQTFLDPFESSSYPLIGKPRRGSGGKGIIVLQEISDFLSLNIDSPEEFVWTRYHSKFDEYSIDFSVNTIGVVSTPVFRKRVFTSGGYAIISESSIAAQSLLAIQLEALIQLFSRKELSGIYNIQVIIGDDFQFVSDVNPRMGTSAVLGKALNNNIVSHAIGMDTYPNSREFKYVRFLEERYFRLIDTKAIQGIVFDLDDTLISNKHFILRRCEGLYERFSTILGDYNSFMIYVLALLNEGKAPLLIDEICRRYRIEPDKLEILNTYRTIYPDHLTVYSDVGNCLKALSEMKYSLFILTDNPIKTQKNKIRHFEYLDYIDKVYYTDSIGKQKPSRDAFDLINRGSGISNKDLVMVGDNYYRDCIGALDADFKWAFHIQRNNGMVTNFEESHKYFNKSNDVIPIDSLTDLTSYFAR